MANNLEFIAGSKAYSIIKESGLKPEMVRVVAGAAGGPKWLVLSRLDRAVFCEFFKQMTKPVYLIGSSIGSWRFAMAGQNNPAQAIERFEHFYIHQTYNEKPTAKEVTLETMRIQHSSLTEAGIREVLDHPIFRLNILSVRCQGPAASENRAMQLLGLGLGAFLNVFSRKLLRLFFERTLFSDPRDIPPFFNMAQFPIRKTPLTPDNIRKALLASGSIPLVMSGVSNIPGASNGVYRDGGVIDYHMDLPLVSNEKIALFPHYSERIIPGWFDKRLTWRGPTPQYMENVLQLAPSRDFIAKLPMSKIPDRNDFYTFQNRDDERIKCWKTVAEATERLGDEFLETVASGKIRDRVRPMFG